MLNAFGFFLVLILGGFLPWRLAVSVPAMLSIPICIALIFLHESPEWLIKNGQAEKCQEGLRFYQNELEEKRIDIHIVEMQAKDNPKKRIFSIWTENVNDFSKYFLSQNLEFWKTFLYLSVLFACIHTQPSIFFLCTGNNYLINGKQPLSNKIYR